MEELFKKLNIKPKNIDLYQRAFIHTSYAYEHNLEYSYEKLEFLGDAIVDLVVSDYLYKKNEFDEGKMTKIRASYVCENALYEYANELEFSKYIQTTILLVDDPDAAVLCRCGIAQSRAAVRRAIVHQDQLKIREGLGKDGSDAGAQKTLCLIYRHDDADFRLFFMLFLHNKLLIASGRFLPSFRPFAA